MKRNCISFFLCFFALAGVFAQEFSNKYGKITNDELNLKQYAKDTSAVAVVIYDDGYTAYDVLNGSLVLNTDYKKKIKILKQEGVDEANITIPYYYKSPSERDNISGIEAVSYNLENGKVVKTKLEKKNIFDEEYNSRTHRIKFSIPNVKAGSVIEVKFRKGSSQVYSLDNWGIQGDIPVITSTYEVKIPEYLQFNIETRGYEHVDVAEVPDNQSFNLGVSSSGAPNVINCTCRRLKFTAKDVPALKDEKFVWCVSDFLSAVRFELKATNFPNQFYKPYSQTWDDLEKTIKNDTDFGSNIKMSNPYKDETKTLLAGLTDEKQKIESIYSFVKKNINWNESYSFSGNKAKEAVKNRTGDNGQINIVLLSMLKDAGIKAFPVFVSRRSRGRLPYTFPSYEMLNTFVVAARTSDGKTYYMDGSAVDGGLNMLPVDLLVDRARVFDDNESEKWVNLSALSRSQQIYNITTDLDKDGNLSGSVTSMYTYQNAYKYKEKFRKAKDSTEFVEKLQEMEHLTINEFKTEGREPMSNSVKENFTFTKTNDGSTDFIYLNPLIVSHINENLFTQVDRKLPVEFEYPVTLIISSNIKIPENYQVAELPKSTRITLNDNCKLTYYITQNGNQISVNYKYEMNQIIFPVSDYEHLKAYFGQLATKNQEMIVLKKI